MIKGKEGTKGKRVIGERGKRETGTPQCLVPRLYCYPLPRFPFSPLPLG